MQQVFVNGVQVNNAVYNPSEVPEPASMVLLGTGITGLAAGVRRRRKQRTEKAE